MCRFYTAWLILLISGSLLRSAAADEVVTATFKGHKNTVTCLAFAPDGKTLVSGSKDGTVILWDFPAGTARATLAGHKDMVASVAIAADGKTLASTSHDNTILLWDLATGKQIGNLAGHTRNPRGVAFSPSSKQLVSGGVDATVRLWSLEDSKQIRCFEGHGAEVNCVAFAPDGKTIASGGWDNTICLWDPESGKVRATLEGHTDYCFPAARMARSGSGMSNRASCAQPSKVTTASCAHSPFLPTAKSWPPPAVMADYSFGMWPRKRCSRRWREEF
jgi:WD40 repeat protein